MFGRCPCCLATGKISKYEYNSTDQTDSFTKTTMSLIKKLTVSTASGWEGGFERKTWGSSVVHKCWQLVILPITAVWPAICFPENSVKLHMIYYNDIIMSVMASQTTGVLIVYPTNCSDADQRRHQSSTSLAFVWGPRWWLVNSQHKGPVTRKMFTFDDVIMSFPYEHYVRLFWFYIWIIFKLTECKNFNGQNWENANFWRLEPKWCPVK